MVCLRNECMYLHVQYICTLIGMNACTSMHLCLYACIMHVHKHVCASMNVCIFNDETKNPPYPS
jgi:hypothetical protein